MTASRTPAERPSLVSKVIDCEPPPVGVATCRATTALRRRTPRRLRPVSRPSPRDATPPRDAIAFTDASLRRVLEVIDRRRPVTQLRTLLTPPVIDTVIALTRSSHTGGTAQPKARGTAATLRRVRLRMVDTTDSDAPDSVAEVFGTYTRGQRVHAIAARVAYNGDRWRIVALQLG